MGKNSKSKQAGYSSGGRSGGTTPNYAAPAGKTSPRPHGLHGTLQVQAFKGRDFDCKRAFITLRVGDVEVGTPVVEITPQGEFVWNQEHTFAVEKNTKCHVCVQVIDADTSIRMGYVEIDFAKMARRTPPLVDTWLPLARSANVIKGTLHMLFFFNHFPDSDRTGGGMYESGYVSPGTPNTMTPLFPPRSLNASPMQPYVGGSPEGARSTTPSMRNVLPDPVDGSSPPPPASPTFAEAPPPAIYRPPGQQSYTSYSSALGDEIPGRSSVALPKAGAEPSAPLSCISCFGFLKRGPEGLERRPAPRSFEEETTCGKMLGECGKM